MPKKLQILVVGSFAVNCMLYWDEETSDGVIIDPGADETAIISEIEQFEFKPRAILLTHAHADHIAAIAPVKEHYQIPLYVGAGEEKLLADAKANISAYFDNPIVAPAADHILGDDQLLQFGSVSLKVLATPGHSPGGVCYYAEDDGLLFCGDTLFAGSVGRTDLPGSSHQLMIDSIRNKIMTLPDDVKCYPGHGPQTTVGTEKKSNPFIIGGQFA